MKTITYNPETHVLVPKGMMYELPELPMPIKGKFSKDLFDGVQMHQYAMRYLDEAIAAAPQPEPVESEPFGYYENGRFSVITDGGPDKYRERKGYQGAIYTTPQPDRVAELEAALKVAKAGIEWALSNINCEPFEWSDEENADAHREAIEALAKINEVLK